MNGTSDRPAPARAGSSRGHYPRRYATLDMWRGVACLLVVLHHSVRYAPLWATYALPTTHLTSAADWVIAAARMGWIGVPMFFVISGYCIAASADAAREKGRGTGDFFRRRFRRIFPPYWAALAFTAACCLVVPAMTAPPDASAPLASFSPSQWFGNLTLTETWREHVFGSPSLWLLGVAWTLAYEEQFYAVAGLCLALAPRNLFRALAWITVLVVPLWWACRQDRLAVRGFFFDGCWLEFAAGVLLYYRCVHAEGRARWGCDAVLGAGTLVTIALASRVAFSPQLTGSMLVASLFAVALTALRPADGRLMRARILSPLKWCGAACYSIYLVHWPILKIVGWGAQRAGIRSDAGTVLVALPVGVAAALAVGSVFHRIVEQRFQSLPERSPQAPVIATAPG